MIDKERQKQYDKSAYTVDKAGRLPRESNHRSYCFAPWLISQVIANETGKVCAVSNSFYLEIDKLEEKKFPD